MSNATLGLTLSSHIYSEGKLRFKLLVPNGVSNYLLYSDEQVFTNEDMITIAIRRKNNIYQLKVFIELGFTKEGDMWYGTERPSQKLINDNDSWIDTDGDTYVVKKDDHKTYLDIPEPLNAILNDLWLGGD